MNRVNAVYALLYNEDNKQVLMVCNKDNNSWTLPGGEVEDNETLVQAVIREVNEETGLIVKPNDIVSINERIFEEEQVQVIFFTFKAEIVGGNISIQYPDEISEIKWVDISTANSLMPYHREGINKLLKNSATYYFQDY